MNTEKILTAFENYIDELRISNKMWRMNQDELSNELLELLEVLLKKEH